MRFSIRLILLLTLLVGLAMAIYRLTESVFTALMMAGSYSVAIGMAQQSWHLWGSRGHLTCASRCSIWGWRYAIAWRIGVIAVVIQNSVVDTLQSLGWQIFPTNHFRVSTDATFISDEGLFHFALIVALLSAPWHQCARQVTWFSVGVACCGGVAGVLLCGLLLWDDLFIHAMVHSTVSQIDAGQTYLRFGTVVHDSDPLGVVRYRSFLIFASGFMLAVSLLTLAGTSLLSRVSRRGCVAIGCAVVAGAALIVAYSVWVHTSGLASVSPHLAEAQIAQTWSAWLLSALLLLAFSLGFVARFQPRGTSDQEPLRWYRGSYWHESRPVQILLAGTLWYFLCDGHEIEWADPSSWWSCLEMLKMVEYNYFPLIIVILGIQGALRRRVNQEDGAKVMSPKEIQLTRFVFAVAATSLATVGLIESATWLTFALMI